MIVRKNDVYINFSSNIYFYPYISELVLGLLLGLTKAAFKSHTYGEFQMMIGRMETHNETKKLQCFVFTPSEWFSNCSSKNLELLVFSDFSSYLGWVKFFIHFHVKRSGMFFSAIRPLLMESKKHYLAVKVWRKKPKDFFSNFFQFFSCSGMRLCDLYQIGWKIGKIHIKSKVYAQQPKNRHSRINIHHKRFSWGSLENFTNNSIQLNGVFRVNKKFQIVSHEKEKEIAPFQDLEQKNLSHAIRLSSVENVFSEWNLLFFQNFTKTVSLSRKPYLWSNLYDDFFQAMYWHRIGWIVGFLSSS